MLKLCSFALLTLAMFCSSAANLVFADVITYTSGLNPQQFSLGTRVAGNVSNNFLSTLNWDGSLGIDFVFPQFNPDFGTLNSVTISFSGASGLTADILFANDQLPPLDIAGITVGMRTNVTLNDATSSVASFGTEFFNNSVTATSSGSPFNFVVGSTAIPGSVVSVPTPGNAAYVGNGLVTLPMNVQFLVEATTSNGAFAVTPFPVLAFSSVQIRYDFTPVPEPTFPAILAALLLAVTLRRSRSI